MKYLNPFKSIFGQGLFVLLLCIGASTATLAVLSQKSATGLARGGLLHRAQEVTAMTAELSGGAIKFGKEEILTGILQKAVDLSQTEQDGALAIDAEGKTLANIGYDTDQMVQLAGLAKVAVKTGLPQVGEDGLTVAYPVRYGTAGTVVGAVSAHWNMMASGNILRENRFRDLAATGGVFLGTMILGLVVLSFGMARPLERMRGAVRRIAEGDYTSDVPGRGRGDEVGEIARALEELRVQLAQAEAATVEARYKGAAFEGSSAALMLIDKDGMVRHVNPAMQRVLNDFAPAIRAVSPKFQPDTLIGSGVEQFHADPGPMRQLMAQSEKGAATMTLTLGGRRLQLTTAMFRDGAGVTLGSVMEWKDVTDDALNAAMLDAINADQCRAEFSADGKLVLCNARFAEAMASPEEALVGAGLDDMRIVSGTERDEGLAARLARGEPAPRRLSLRRPDGGSVSFDCGLVAVRDPKGKAERLLFLGRDVTAEERRVAAAEAARVEMTEAQGRVVDALRVGLRRMREGDLTLQMSEPFPAQYEELRGDYNATLETLARALGEIADNASNIFSEARDISSTADQLSRRTESTSATLEETAAALDQLTGSVRTAAERAAKADDEVGEARRRAEKGGEVVVETVEAMDRISTSSDKIASITNVIEDIAFQTNLLALNAGVEAARAGEAGRGFAVVASEVRALAQRCSEAAREINELIADSGSHVKHGVDLVGQTGEALREIVRSITGINSLVSEIAGSARQQSAGLAEINAAVNDLDQSTQQNAARLEETTAASQSLTNDAMSMVEAVSHFQIGRTTAAAETVVSFASRRDPGRAASDGGTTEGADAKDAAKPVSKSATKPVAQPQSKTVARPPAAPAPKAAASAPARAASRLAVGAGDELVEADPDGWSEY
ncbi:methyl-accepting chemotaxis protein [Acidimangrovimonas sediminis]|uniref:methyl-accepting chemotaxis protein n=1 Tax=Acidimangrovimonas sediminis TaxID=2056283 RepID=UPI000C801B00|nr:methyl-accepting chemotaxis protein [Acidimangrovimonas sediminis]